MPHNDSHKQIVSKHLIQQQIISSTISYNNVLYAYFKNKTLVWEYIDHMVRTETQKYKI